MADNDADKSQEATPHRREKAREQGQVARSHDLASAAILVAGIAALMWLGAALVDSLGGYIARQLGGDAWLTIDAPTLSSEGFLLGVELAKTLLPILALMFGVAVAANFLQTGPLFLTDKLMPDWSHINPLTGFQRLFSLASAVRLGFGLIKISLIGAIAGYGLWQKRDEVLGLVGLEIGEIAFYLADTTLWMCLKIAAALLILAILDYGFQRWKYERDLRMTPQEVREEMKDLQGDPHVIARRRQVQRQLALSRIKSAVPTADVVVTNPTELAIAIRYDAKEMAAPIVVAKGAGVVAQRIRLLAAEHHIPIVENKPLARLLYKEVDVNHPIPDKAYAAVAEVLAYVYQLKGKTVTRAA